MPSSGRGAGERGACSLTLAVPRAVLDTNVVLSALVFAGGSTARLRQAWQAGRLLPLVSTATAQELMRVLAYPKFKLDAQAQQELLADYLPWAEAVAVPEPPPRVPECRDVDDLPFLHLAGRKPGRRCARQRRRRSAGTSRPWCAHLRPAPRRSCSPCRPFSKACPLLQHTCA
ncbi:MAG: putative toxin-antitoxin system toxin component, PIN family [Rubrivivax sp.]